MTKRPTFPATLPATLAVATLREQGGPRPKIAIKNVATNPLNTLANADFYAKTDVAQSLRAAHPAVAPPRQQSAMATPGPGLVSDVFRQQMLNRLRAGGVAHEGVLAAFAATPRHVFVDPALAAQAYEDTSLPIGLGQTISKPSVVARMLSLLMAAPGAVAAQAAGRASASVFAGRVLEIGTGCGYQAALLACLAIHVTSIERLAGLHDKAQANLLPLAHNNLHTVLGDGMLGHPRHAPYMGIIAAAGGERVPQAWLDQLAPGGRIVAPVADANGQQWLTVIDKTSDGLREQRLAVVQFVPLKSGVN